MPLTDNRAAASFPTTVPAAGGRFGRRLGEIPLLYKVLFANVAIVVVGAIAGTYVTAATLQELSAPSRHALAFVFAAIGVIASGLVNYAVLRAAFQPLESLERLAEQVRHGDLSARAPLSPVSDPNLVRLVETFNSTLDELEHDQAQLRHLAIQVIEAQEDERKRIARELHDDTAQVLFAQLLRATALKSSPHREVRETASQLESLTGEAIESVRRLALELRPPALDDLGLREALEALAQRFSDTTGIDVDLNLGEFRNRLRAEVELVLYRVAQEALTNTGKHARASRVSIVLRREPGRVDLTIDDNGTGFDPGAAAIRDEQGLGLGLFGMEERVSLVGGVLAVRQLAPNGTRVAASIPTDPAPTRSSPSGRNQDRP
ncbi:MAG TPA: sensor histidine kinase [Thermomicrobiales bacterium]|nr:sensor histidine kinase [Thermomicrobiales bacterium]